MIDQLVETGMKGAEYNIQMFDSDLVPILLLEFDDKPRPRVEIAGMGGANGAENASILLSILEEKNPSRYLLVSETFVANPPEGSESYKKLMNQEIMPRDLPPDDRFDAVTILLVENDVSMDTWFGRIESLPNGKRHIPKWESQATVVSGRLAIPRW